MLEDAKLELKKSKRKDYYKILGIPKSAGEDQIKKAYKKEALKHHPGKELLVSMRPCLPYEYMNYLALSRYVFV